MLPVGMKNLGKSLAVPPKIKQLSAIPLQDSCPGEMKTGMHRRMYMNVHSSTIHSRPEVGTILVSMWSIHIV